MKRICIVTATRAEYGLLKNIIGKFVQYDDLDICIVATGMHLEKRFGETWREIEADGYTINEKLPIIEHTDTPRDISNTMAKGLISFATYFERVQPDMLIVLGDRYEMVSVCIAAMNQRIPIAHLYGGETTEGAYDEAFRHAITKMSYLHFTALEEYRRRIIQLGEAPERVFNVGSMGVENIITQPLLTKEELSEELNIDLNKSYAVVTFHPVTLENSTTVFQIDELLAVIDQMPFLQFIITKANADTEGELINEMFAQYVLKHQKRVFLVDSLGTIKYLSALKYADFVIGNSSSGIMEAPVFRIPTINIGDRQRGRIRPDSVIDCQPMRIDILRAIQFAKTKKFKDCLASFQNPYYSECTSQRITQIVYDFVMKQTIDLKKKFYDIDFEVIE